VQLFSAILKTYPHSREKMYSNNSYFEDLDCLLLRW